MSAGICGYFIAVSLFLLFFFNGRYEIGLALMIAFAGLSTMLLLYGNMNAADKYEKADNTLVEEMKAQMASGKKANKLASLASSSLWTIVAALYIAISFISGQWHITWIIFLIAAMLQNLMQAFFNPAAKMKFFIGAYWCFVVTVYFLISFATSAWHISWIMYLVAAAFMQSAKFFAYWKNGGAK
jgi:hypothetical protein